MADFLIVTVSIAFLTVLTAKKHEVLPQLSQNALARKSGGVRKEQTASEGGAVQQDVATEEQSSSPEQTVAKPAPDFSKLSRREKEVAQIADELFISTQTVKRHLATIFEKLGITSRRELWQGIR